MVVQSSRSGYGPLNLALFDLGMVPWAGLSRGRATGTSFGSLCHFRIILRSFWGVPWESLGSPWGLPGGFLGEPRGLQHRSGTGDPKSLQSVYQSSKTGIIAVLFSRTDLSIGGIGTTLHALLHRHGCVGPSFQGMPEQFDFHDFSFTFF